MSDKPIVIEKMLGAPVEKVWQAITDTQHMKHWYFDLEKFIPEVGFRFQFTGGPEDGIQYLHLCEIQEVVTQRKISYSWKYDGYSGSSVVSFELFPEGNKTRVVLTHSGLETFPDDNPDFAKKNFEAGWTHIIGTALPDYAEKLAAS